MYILIAVPLQQYVHERDSYVTWCFSDRASWVDYILITNFDALIIIYS